MKYFLFTLFALTTLFASAQSSSIIGKIIDAEEGDSPLLFAKVTIKETGDKVMTGDKGTFTFENLKEGTYTLVYSFTGYETKEIVTKVISQNNKAIAVTLSPSTLSLDDISMVLVASDNKTNTASRN